mmetsp:Transcript_112347/g.312627  ORF Transcript_112347/g.312627 Transcript_112347/m.312627 type:complete len:215 (+) Transcript_112347:788-1432(+)
MQDCRALGGALPTRSSLRTGGEACGGRHGALQAPIRKLRDAAPPRAWAHRPAAAACGFIERERRCRGLGLLRAGSYQQGTDPWGTRGPGRPRACVAPGAGALDHNGAHTARARGRQVCPSALEWPRTGRGTPAAHARSRGHSGLPLWALRRGMLGGYQCLFGRHHPVKLWLPHSMLDASVRIEACAGALGRSDTMALARRAAQFVSLGVCMLFL